MAGRQTQELARIAATGGGSVIFLLLSTHPSCQLAPRHEFGHRAIKAASTKHADETVAESVRLTTTTESATISVRRMPVDFRLRLD